MKKLVLPLLIILIMTSCDPCRDCGEPLLSEPTVEMIFINQDSINIITDSLSFFTFNDSALASNIFILDTLRDRLEEVQVGLDTADNVALEQEKMDIEQLIPTRIADSLLFATLNTDSDSLTTLLDTKRSSISSGFIRISMAELVETQKVIFSDTSETSWNFPLLFDGSQASYDIFLWDELFSVSVGYVTSQEINDEREVVIRASDIRVLETTGFDSLTNCETNCIDGNASFTFYF